MSSDDAPSSLHRTARNVRGILRFARPHWRLITVAFVLMAIESSMSMGRLVVVMPLVDRVIPEGGGDEATEVFRKVKERGGALYRGVDAVVGPIVDVTRGWVPDSWVDPAHPETREHYATLLAVLVLFVGLIVLMSVATFGESYLAEKARLSIVMDVRQALCTNLLAQPVAFHDQKRRGDVLQRVLGDVEGYSSALNLLLKEVAKAFFMLAVGVTILVLASWQLSLVCLLGVPFLVPLYKLTKRTIKRSHKRAQETSRRTETTLQIFSGIRTVKAFGTEARRIADFRRADEEVTRRSLRVQQSKSTADTLTEFINNFLAMVLIVGGGFLVLRGTLDITLPELMVFFLVLLNLYQPIKRLVRQFNHFQDAMASVERTNEWLALPPGLPDRPDAAPFPGIREAIRFENVGFAYVEGRPVIRGVTFEVPRGKTVALVGPSGGGKSTLCDLLLRFYDPQEGRITVDGVDLRDFRRASYLARTAVVTQAPFLFHTTVRENIRQGKLDATEAEIEAAARAAQVHEFVLEQPQGYDTEVGEMGTRLSGGQRQRITIARALVRDPEILVLDEATASLDTQSEKAVQEALERLRAGRTTLVVAHRLSTVRHADRIVVLDDGRVVEEGTHEDLIARGGLYANLVRMQDLTPVAAGESPSQAD